MKAKILNFVNYKRNKEREAQIRRYESAMGLLSPKQREDLIEAPDMMEIFDDLNNIPKSDT